MYTFKNGLTRIAILIVGIRFALAQVLSDFQRRHQASYVRGGPTPRIHSRNGLDYYGGQKEDLAHFWEALRRILIVRPAGSKGSSIVRKYIIDEMKRLGWTVQLDEFENETPVGKRRFSNVIATLNPSVPRRFIIAAHYDSKLLPKGFLGATDSAVPCAQMLNLAQTMELDLKHHKARPFQNVTLQFVFFDGEEPFKAWRGNDNTYGSRHLADRWDRDSLLNGIDILLLLDLLGASSPKILSLDSKTHGWYQLAADVEKKVVNRFPHLPKDKIFRKNARLIPGRIEDDHIPFFNRGVPVLHFIPYPFPDVWHKIEDNLSVVDGRTVEKLNKILRVFVAEYLGMPP